MPLPDKINGTLVMISIMIGFFAAIAAVETARNGLLRVETIMWWSSVAVITTAWVVELRRTASDDEKSSREK